MCPVAVGRDRSCLLLAAVRHLYVVQFMASSSPAIQGLVTCCTVAGEGTAVWWMLLPKQIFRPNQAFVKAEEGAGFYTFGACVCDVCITSLAGWLVRCMPITVAG